jgi:hypothetical protein
MSKAFFKKLFLSSHDSLESDSLDLKHNVEIDKINDNVYYISGDEEHDEIHNHESQKFANEEDPLLLIKLQIVQSRLSLMFEAIKKSFDSVLLSFFEGLKTKAEIVKLFNKDDNYLYLLPNTKLTTFKNIYAYRRLLYVIRSYKYRTVILSSCFYKWKALAGANIILLDKPLSKAKALLAIFNLVENAMVYNKVMLLLFYGLWRDRMKALRKKSSGSNLNVYNGITLLKNVFKAVLKRQYRDFILTFDCIEKSNSNNFND